MWRAPQTATLQGSIITHASSTYAAVALDPSRHSSAAVEAQEATSTPMSSLNWTGSPDLCLASNGFWSASTLMFHPTQARQPAAIFNPGEAGGKDIAWLDTHARRAGARHAGAGLVQQRLDRREDINSGACKLAVCVGSQDRVTSRDSLGSFTPYASPRVNAVVSVHANGTRHLGCQGLIQVSLPNRNLSCSEIVRSPIGEASSQAHPSPESAAGLPSASWHGPRPIGLPESWHVGEGRRLASN